MGKSVYGKGPVSFENITCTGTSIGFGTPYMGSGKVFFVNGESYGPAASDDYAGTNPNNPLATITQAIENCRQRTQDYIFVQGFYQTDSFPIDLDKRDIRIIGIGNGGVINSRCLVDGAGDACFTTGGSGGGFELAGFRLGSTGAACIELLASTWNVHIHDCTFGHLIVAQDGILSDSSSYQPIRWTVDHCLFGNALTRDGVRIPADCHGYWMDNMFREIPEKGISITMGEVGAILRNYFYAPIVGAEAAGWAITLGNVHGGIIMQNHASQHATMSAIDGNNPYLDTSTGTLETSTNGWSENWDGQQAAAYPDVA